MCGAGFAMDFFVAQRYIGAVATGQVKQETSSSAGPVVMFDAEFRLGLQRLLALLGDRESFSIVQADLGDEDPQIRAGAIRLIGELGLSEYLPNILDRLQKIYGKQQSQKELPFTVAVFSALKKIGTTEIAEELSRRFEQLPEYLRLPALYVIAAHGAGSEPIDRFFQGLLRPDTPHPDLRPDAIELYGALVAREPGPALAMFRSALTEGNPDVSRAAAAALAGLLAERVFEISDWPRLPSGLQAQILRIAPSVPAAAPGGAMESEHIEVKQEAVTRILSAAEPPHAILDVIRIFSAESEWDTVGADALASTLARWYSTGQGRLALVQMFSYILRRPGGVLEKFLPAPGPILADIDRLIARLRRALLRTGSPRMANALADALIGKAAPAGVIDLVDGLLSLYPREKELRATVEELLGIPDERTRKRIASEVRQIPAGAFIPLKKILKILPPLKEPSLNPTLKIIRDLSRAHSDAELEWLAVTHLAGCGDPSAAGAVCDAALRGVAESGDGESHRGLDVSVWLRTLSMDTAPARIRETLLAIIRRTSQPDTFRAAVELLSVKNDPQVSSALMERLPDLVGTLRFTAIQAIGRMGDRVHLPVFLAELSADRQERQLAGLLGLEKLLDANPDLPPNTVSTPLYELNRCPDLTIRTAAVGLLVRLNDPNRMDLVADIVAAPQPVPASAYRLVSALAQENISEEDRTKLFRALLSRIGRMSDEDSEPIADAFRAVLAGRPFASLLQTERQRADEVQDLSDLLRRRSGAQAATDFKISKSIQRRSIAFIDITGFTPRASRLTAIELGVFLVQVEDEILPYIKKHEGALIKRLGDGFLVSYPGSVRALTSGLEMLQFLARKNQLLQEEDRVRLRIGIHTGDVLVARDDVFGDTVNVAARVEALGKPMCVTFTEDVFRDLPGRNRVIEPLGPTKLKGRDEPIEIYRIRLDVIYEAQTDAIRKVMAMPDWMPKIKKFKTDLEERYRRLSEKIEEAEHMAERGDFAHAESLVIEIEKQML